MGHHVTVNMYIFSADDCLILVIESWMESCDYANNLILHVCKSACVLAEHLSQISGLTTPGLTTPGLSRFHCTFLYVIYQKLYKNGKLIMYMHTRLD